MVNPKAGTGQISFNSQTPHLSHFVLKLANFAVSNGLPKIWFLPSRARNFGYGNGV